MARAMRIESIMLNHIKSTSLLRRLLLTVAVAGALALGMVACERSASAQAVQIEVVPPYPVVTYGWAPGYWDYDYPYWRRYPWYGYGYRHGWYGHSYGWGRPGGWGGHGHWGGHGGWGHGHHR
jgi:hypothetical protein